MGAEPQFGPLKNNVPRTIELSADTVALLKAHRKHQAEIKMANRTTYQDFGLVFAKEWRELRGRQDARGPRYLYRDDIEEIGSARSAKPLLIPKSSLLEMRVDLREDGSLSDEERVVIDLRETASRQSPLEYRVDGDSHVYSFIPFRTRDKHGRWVQLTPILDRRVTIPRGTRKVFEQVNLLTESLQQQTGVRVSCCQAVVAGIPWGNTVVSFGAKDEPARSVLLQLLRLEPGPDRFVPNEQSLLAKSGRRPEHWRWTMRCEPRDA